MKKKILPALALCVAMLASCSGSDKEAADNAAAIDSASREELATAVKDRDELLSLMTEIQQGLTDIKNLENIVSAPSTAETPDKRAQVKSDIAAIQQALIDRQARLEELEKKLSASNLYTKNLKETIETLRTQIENQGAEITRLTGELDNAKAQIAHLDTQVDSLNTTVSNVSSERDAAQEQSAQLTAELNTCYYAIGSSKELKEHKILQSGFLKKTKIMKGDFDQAFFTRADKATLRTIPLHSKKAEVLTNQPKDSYTITDHNGQKVLNITNPEKFWSLTNYLVIKIN